MAGKIQPTASRIIAVLIERLGGPQTITYDEYARFECNYPAVVKGKDTSHQIVVDVEK